MTTTLLPTTQRRGLALVLGVPIAWAIVLLAHPTGDGTDVFAAIDGQLGAWMFVHLTMVAFIPLMALAVHRLLQGVDNTPARISRWALPVFVVAYGLFEGLMGIGNGILVATSDGVPRGSRAEMVQSFSESSLLGHIETVGSLSWCVALVAAAFALHRVRALGPWSVGALVVAAPLIAMHAPPMGPVGLALFVIGVGARSHEVRQLTARAAA